MASKYDLHHWDNFYLKTLAIVCICWLKNNIYLVSNGSNKIATFQTRKDGDVLKFFKLATVPDCMGKGIGSFCLKEIENIALSLGCKEVSCDVYDKSEHALNFYLHKGYTVCGTKETLKYKELELKKVFGE